MVSTKTKKTTAKKSVAKKKATKKAVAEKDDIKTIVDPSVMPSDKKFEKKNSGNIILIIIAIALVAIFFIIK
ncbi:MAG: hypothetical protein ACJ0GZ_04130 [Alphaproteobacteria bacterium]